MRESARQNAVNVRLIFDTARLTKGDAPSGDQAAQLAEASPECAFMIVEGAAEPAHANAHFTVAAHVGEVVHLYGVSGSNNFDDAVLIESLEHVDGKKVVPVFEPVSRSRKFRTPSVGANVLPGVEREHRAWWHAGVVARHGAGTYRLRFALFVRDDDGQLHLHRRFQLSPVIKLTGAHRDHEHRNGEPNNEKE